MITVFTIVFAETEILTCFTLVLDKFVGVCVCVCVLGFVSMYVFVSVCVCVGV